MDKLPAARDSQRGYYFAYGSNMDHGRLRETVPVIYKAFPALLEGWQFAYNKLSYDGTGKGNINRMVAGVVYGVCYEINSEDFSKLDTLEKGYERQLMPIRVVKDGHPCFVLAHTYVAERPMLSIDPSPEYRTVIRDAAHAKGLPLSYIERNL